MTFVKFKITFHPRILRRIILRVHQRVIPWCLDENILQPKETGLRFSSNFEGEPPRPSHNYKTI